MSFTDATPQEIDAAMVRAASAHELLLGLERVKRADLLDAIAIEIEGLGDTLLEAAAEETALGMARLTGERGRTVGQLRLLAGAVRDGSCLEQRVDGEIRQMLRPIGPVVIFGASNFPLAFSVAGGDTASALAAGCPVVCKAHPFHPRTSQLVGDAIGRAAASSGMPNGTFSLLHGAGHAVGLSLVEHPLARAVGFTGSLAGGRAIFDAACARPDPIPVFAEMGSTNPSFLMPDRLAGNAEDLASGFCQSMTLGVGQFCTNPGLIFGQAGPDLDRFGSRLEQLVKEAPDGTMLHDGIQAAYGGGLERLAGIDGVTVCGRPQAQGQATPALLVTDGTTFLANPDLTEELFGPSSLLIHCDSREQLLEATRSLPGQLSACIHAEPTDVVEDLIRVLELKAGRLVYNDFPTGVAVGPAMHHGGPYPATTDSRSTSVGTLAIRRFGRPVCYQGFPEERLPVELR